MTNLCYIKVSAEHHNSILYLATNSENGDTTNDECGEENMERTTNAGNIKRILITNEVFAHYLRYGN